MSLQGPSGARGVPEVHVVRKVEEGQREAPPVQGGAKVQGVVRRALNKLADAALAYFMGSLEAYVGKVQPRQAPPRQPAPPEPLPVPTPPPETTKVEQPAPPASQKSPDQVRQEEIKDFEEGVKSNVEGAVKGLKYAENGLAEAYTKEAKLKELGVQVGEVEGLLNEWNADQKRKADLKKEMSELHDQLAALDQLDALDRPKTLTKLKKSRVTELQGLLDKSTKKVNKKFDELTRDDVAKAFGMKREGWFRPKWVSGGNPVDEQALDLFDQIKDPKHLKLTKQKELKAELENLNEQINELENELSKINKEDLELQLRELKKDQGKLSKDLKTLGGKVATWKEGVEQAKGKAKIALNNPFGSQESKLLTAYINNLAAQGQVEENTVVSDVMAVLVKAVPTLNDTEARARLEEHVEAHRKELDFSSDFDATLEEIDSLAAKWLPDAQE